MKEQDKLIGSYLSVLEQLNIDDSGAKLKIYSTIKRSISDFMNCHTNVAIYCYGKHTKMLMADFIFELKDIACIIDNGIDDELSGFRIIHDSEINQNHLDGIIISSYKYLNEIKEELKRNHPSIDILDIYDNLNKKGISLRAGYYESGPYVSYSKINELHNLLDESQPGETRELVIQLLRECVSIKDFRLALEFAKLLKDDSEINEIVINIKALYEMELDAVSNIDGRNVLLICMDGMRAGDLSSDSMPKSCKYLIEHGHMYDKAYAFSTSTFESLVPAFSENTDQRTGYYNTSEVPSKSCRFIKEAISQERDIYIYGDAFHYITDECISYADHPQTFSEKIWDFVTDATGCTNGLFYLHELYESHFSYPNPYTTGKMIADGTAMVFDFIPEKGGGLRTDYETQHNDSIRYLDDTLFPVLHRLKCSVLLFADHGNMIMNSKAKMEELRPIDLTASEEWIRVPFAVISNQFKACRVSDLVSLLDINDFMIALLNKKRFDISKRRYIKIGRSALYNPDFIWIYNKLGYERYLNAFEGFVFEDGYKLLVFSDGLVELYYGDGVVHDEKIKGERYEEIRGELSVV